MASPPTPLLAVPTSLAQTQLLSYMRISVLYFQLPIDHFPLDNLPSGQTQRSQTHLSISQRPLCYTGLLVSQTRNLRTLSDSILVHPAPCYHLMSTLHSSLFPVHNTHTSQINIPKYPLFMILQINILER